MNAYRPGRVVVYADLEMPEHLHLRPVVFEGSLAAHGLVRHDRFRFLGRVLALPKNLPRLAVATVQQPVTVQRDQPPTTGRAGPARG